MDTWWTWPIATLGLLGTWLAGRQRTALAGWIVSTVVQVFWLAYVTTTRQWGLLPPAIITMVIFVRNVAVNFRKCEPVKCDVEEAR